MVLLTKVLRRVPVIKFRKGGSPAGSAAAPAAGTPAAASVPSASQATQTQASAPMSTSAIPDLDLPARYRRAPLSEEEIAHINGGGIKVRIPLVSKTEKKQLPRAVAALKIPKGVLLTAGGKKELITLNIILQKSGK